MTNRLPFDLNTPAPLSVAQLADRWGCSTALVRKLIDKGEVKAFRLGTLIRIPVAEVERYEGRADAEAPITAVATQDESASPGTLTRQRIIPRARRRRPALQRPTS
ncbi:hypothetical protein NRB_01930 [Novosphingobium sp. 11B]